MKGKFKFIAALGLLIPAILLAQTSGETREKRRLEKVIEKGAGNFTINDDVGLGTPGPDGKLHVYSGDSTASVDADGDEIIAENSGNAGITIATPGGNVGALLFADPSAVKAGGIQYYHGDDSMRFNTNGSNERMRIDSTGRVSIGPIAPGDQLDVNNALGAIRAIVRTTGMANTNAAEFRAQGQGNGATRYASIGVYYNSGATTNAPAGFTWMQTSDDVSNFLWVDDSDKLRISTTQGHIGTLNGTVVGDQTSDERTKSNIRPLHYGLLDVLKLKPIAYVQDQEEKIGFGAQTTMNVIPEAVYDTKVDIDGTDKTKLAMKYHRITPVLVKAIQDQQAIIEKQKTEIVAMKSWICSQYDAPLALCGGMK